MWSLVAACPYMLPAEVLSVLCGVWQQPVSPYATSKSVVNVMWSLAATCQSICPLPLIGSVLF